jgi:hypothetical protein
MKAFISYSHQDTQSLDLLHKHLTQLQREGAITAWTDNEIMVGGNLNQDISSALTSSNLFIALLSPDYIASDYCYEKEFQRAIELNEQGKIIIVPVILEPCDWLSTPFQAFKAVPRDGKAIATWENKNTAFLEVIQSIRKLVSSKGPSGLPQKVKNNAGGEMSRNYRVKKDFDSIERMEFCDKTFSEVKEHLKRYLTEVIELDNIKARTIQDDDSTFESILVNRNKINTESELKFFVENVDSYMTGPKQKQLAYTITKSDRFSNQKDKFTLANDDYHLFWKKRDSNFNMKEFDSKEIADLIWNEWLESVGIL